MRLRSLPLSLAGIIAGMALASTVVPFNTVVVTFLVLTTVFLQILSNLSNELGDYLQGTDNEHRHGIHYSLQDGEMTVPQMKGLISVTAVLCCISGVVLLWCSFGTLFSLEALCFLVLGGLAVWAAIRYTLGRNPYGYKGFGDISVFIFFGLVAVLGAAYICSHTVNPLWLIPAAAFGLWSIGVLNVNNIRDMKTDAATRTTMAIRLGPKRARLYHTGLIAGGWVLMAVYTVLTFHYWTQWIYSVTLPLFVLHLYNVWTKEDRALDPMLPLLVISTFLTSVLFAVVI